MGRAFSNSYLAGEPAAHAFFAPLFRDPDARIARTRLAAERTAHRTVIEVLQEQQAGLPPSAARKANLAALDGKAAVVVTGQQVGLFLGPLYAFYKAASAIAAARALEAEARVRCVPLFWLQTEDHDFDEIRSCTVAGQNGEPVRLALPDDPERERVSVAHRALPGQVAELLNALADALGPGPAAQETMALLRESYRPGRAMAAAFAQVMAAVFAEEGLLVFNPRDARIAALAAPVYRASLEDSAAIERRLQDRRGELAAARFKEQVAVREQGSLVFFHRDGAEGPRFRIQRRVTAAGDVTWALAGGTQAVGHQDVLKALAAEPLRFSTSALLRPIVQDTLLPTAAYVGGPGEINYFAQLPPLYQHFDLPPPLLVPRARFCCVDARARRWLRELGLAPADLSLPRDELRARLAVRAPEGMASPADLRGLVDQHIAPALARLTSLAAAADAGLARAAERTKGSVTHNLERLLARHARTLAERDQTTLRRLEGLQTALYPEGVPQERYYGWASLAGRHGVFGLKRLVMDKLQAGFPFPDQVQDLQP